MWRAGRRRRAEEEDRQVGGAPRPWIVAWAGACPTTGAATACRREIEVDRSRRPAAFASWRRRDQAGMGGDRADRIPIADGRRPRPSGGGGFGDAGGGLTVAAAERLEEQGKNRVERQPRSV